MQIGQLSATHSARKATMESLYTRTSSIHGATQRACEEVAKANDERNVLMSRLENVICQIKQKDNGMNQLNEVCSVIFVFMWMHATISRSIAMQYFSSVISQINTKCKFDLFYLHVKTCCIY